MRYVFLELSSYYLNDPFRKLPAFWGMVVQAARDVDENYGARGLLLPAGF